MKVGIIGSGEVAKTLGSGFLKHGHQVTLGTRHPGQLEDWKKSNSTARTGTFADAASFGDVIVLAVKVAPPQRLSRVLAPRTSAPRPSSTSPTPPRTLHPATVSSSSSPALTSR